MNDRHAVPPLSLDPANERAHLRGHPVKLTPKAFAVLRHLMERPGLLATKNELLSRVWPDTIVTEASLSTCIREIRRALDDDAARPAYVQTVHRRGYRYVGPVADAEPAASGGDVHTEVASVLVGRERELAALDRVLHPASHGGRRLILVSGEAGIGKTALITRFIGKASRDTGVVIARGQCVEYYGACEPYLPWFEVLNQLSQSCGREQLAGVLRRCAPMWLSQLPWLIEAAERQTVRLEIAGAQRERMVRELAEALAEIGAEAQLVIVLEDLHWSDPSSIDLLAYLARRAQRNWTLIGSYRPAELHASSHPLVTLKQDLLLHGVCEELPLDLLTPEAVARYVNGRLPGAPDVLATGIHRRTDGNPLFMVNVLDYLLACGAVVHSDGCWRLSDTSHSTCTRIPESLKDMIERQLDRLTGDEQSVLEIASVPGAAFSAALVAAMADAPLESIEDRLASLARRGSFLRAADRVIWPDGTESDGYAFIHALYQQVLYERIGTARRRRMHRVTGERLEAALGERASDIAAELALHFQRGRDDWRAVRYLTTAGENAMRRGAFVEAAALLNQGLDVLPSLQGGPRRDRCELDLRVLLGSCYLNTKGYAAADVGITFERARTLSRHVDEPMQTFRALRGQWFFALLRADLPRAHAIAAELLDVAARADDGGGLVEAHRFLATTWFHLGHYSRALDHVRQGLALYDPERHAAGASRHSHDSGVCCYAWQAWVQWHSGYPDQAVASATQSIELARRLDYPFNVSYAMNFAAQLYQCRGDADAAERHSREAIRFAREHGLSSMLAMGQILHGWSQTRLRSVNAGVRELQEGIAGWRSTGASLAMGYWMYLLASALDTAGRHAEAIDTVDAALAQSRQTDERWSDCELQILKASLLAPESAGDDEHALAERMLSQAFDAATTMQSPPLRLRAATAMTRVLRDRRKTRAARRLVASEYRAFSEGFETRDLVDARAVLAAS